jgi:hypothetical protein
MRARQGNKGVCFTPYARVSACYRKRDNFRPAFRLSHARVRLKGRRQVRYICHKAGRKKIVRGQSSRAAFFLALFLLGQWYENGRQRDCQARITNFAGLECYCERVKRTIPSHLVGNRSRRSTILSLSVTFHPTPTVTMKSLSTDCLASAI